MSGDTWVDLKATVERELVAAGFTLLTTPEQQGFGGSPTREVGLRVKICRGGSGQCRGPHVGVSGTLPGTQQQHFRTTIMRLTAAHPDRIAWIDTSVHDDGNFWVCHDL